MPVLDNGPVRIHYQVIGTGPAGILLSEAGGDSRLWQHAGYVNELPGFRLMLVDQRGRGQSSRLEDHRMECFV